MAIRHHSVISFINIISPIFFSKAIFPQTLDSGLWSAGLWDMVFVKGCKKQKYWVNNHIIVTNKYCYLNTWSKPQDMLLRKAHVCCVLMFTWLEMGFWIKFSYFCNRTWKIWFHISSVLKLPTIHNATLSVGACVTPPQFPFKNYIWSFKYFMTSTFNIIWPHFFEHNFQKRNIVLSLIRTNTVILCFVTGSELHLAAW